MKKCTLFVTLWLFMCFTVMAQLTTHSSQLTRDQLYESWLSQGKPIKQPVAKSMQARTIPLNFDFILIDHSLPTTTIPINTYSVLFESAEYTGIVQFYKTPTASEIIPIGNYNVTGDFKESTVLQGIEFGDLTLGSYFSKIENGQVVEQYLFSSGQLSVEVDANNANHITITGSIIDTKGNTLEISATHVVDAADKYYAEPETTVSCSQPLNRVQYSVNTKTKLLDFVMMNDTISVNMSMYRDSQAGEDVTNFGVFQLDGTGAINTFKKSNGFNTSKQLDPCFVQIKNTKYALVSGTVTLREKEDKTGFTMLVNALSYKGSSFEFVAEYFYSDSAYQLEGFKVNKTLNVTKCQDRCLSQDRTLPLDTFLVQFTAKDYVMMLRVTVDRGTSSALPNGVYQVASVLGNGTIKGSAGANGTQDDLFSIAVGDFNMFGTPQSLYFITSGTLTKESDPNHAGEFIYTFHLRSYYGSIFESTFNTFIEPYGAEPSSIINIDEDWNYVSSVHTIADASQGESLDSYEIILKNEESRNQAKLVLYADLASPKNIEAGRYEISSTKEQGKIVAGTVDPTDRTKLLPSYITYDNETYFIKTGSCTISYPDASNEYHINVALSVTSAKGSTFNISLNYIIDPYEGYTYNYESTTSASIVFNPKSVSTSYSSDKQCTVVDLTNDTLRCHLEASLSNTQLTALPAGSYQVTPTKAENTLFKSPGISPQGVVAGSYFGKIDASGQLQTVYYIVGGTLTVADSDQGKSYTLNFSTFHSSTINGVLTVGTGVETIHETLMQVSVDEHNIVVENAYGNVEVFNTMGQKVFSISNCDGSVTIHDLPTNSVYFVKCNKDMVKLIL